MSDFYLLQLFTTLILGSYGYTFVSNRWNVKKDQFKDVKDKIDEIYRILVEKALDQKEEEKK